MGERTDGGGGRLRSRGPSRRRLLLRRAAHHVLQQATLVERVRATVAVVYVATRKAVKTSVLYERCEYEEGGTEVSGSCGLLDHGDRRCR